MVKNNWITYTPQFLTIKALAVFLTGTLDHPLAEPQVTAHVSVYKSKSFLSVGFTFPDVIWLFIELVLSANKDVKKIFI